MKLVFTLAELADSLQITADQFREHRRSLEANGFPKPLPEIDERWSIMDVVNWVNGNTRHRPAESSTTEPAARLS